MVNESTPRRGFVGDENKCEDSVVECSLRRVSGNANGRAGSTSAGRVASGCREKGFDTEIGWHREDRYGEHRKQRHRCNQPCGGPPTCRASFAMSLKKRMKNRGNFKSMQGVTPIDACQSL